MYEVEVKVEAAHDPLRERLAALDAEARGTVHQRDTYYDHPVRSFAETDEALRLRRERVAEDVPPPGSRASASRGGPGETATLTYKGPRVDDVSKTRREVETAVADPDATDELLRSVGFEPAADVEKERERFDCGGFAVALDRVAGLGEFVEVEAEADPGGGEARREGAFELLGRLGLDPDAVTRTSYLALLLASRDGDRRGPSPDDN